jgi:hypothetical protein
MFAHFCYFAEVKHFIDSFLFFNNCMSFKDIQLLKFKQWEKRRAAWFSSPLQVQCKAIDLSQCQHVKKDAAQAILDYASHVLGVDIESLEDMMVQWEGGNGSGEGGVLPVMQLVSGEGSRGDVDDDDLEGGEDGDDYDEAEGEEEDDDDDEEDIVPLECQEEDVPLSLRSPHLLNKVKELGNIIRKRISKREETHSSEILGDYIYPATTRSVERMFSGWKRLMVRNANTRASTMQALSLLSCFEYDEIMLILQDSLTTPDICKFTTELMKSQRDELNAHFYRSLTQKTQQSREKARQVRIWSQIRKEYNIDKPTSKAHIWTKKHSLQFLARVGKTFTVGERKKLKADALQKLVLTSYEEQKQLSPLPPIGSTSSSALLFLQGDDNSNGGGVPSLPSSLPPSLPPSSDSSSAVAGAGVVGDGDVGDGGGPGVGGHDGESSDDDDNDHECGEVLSHEMIDGEVKYETTWVGSEGITWEPQSHFERGFILCDYWRTKCQQYKRWKRKPGCSESDSEPELELEDSRIYDVEKALDHHERGGFVEYLVKWKKYLDVSWEKEESFDCDGGNVVLVEYWRDKFLKEKGERVCNNNWERGKKNASRFLF